MTPNAFGAIASRVLWVHDVVVLEETGSTNDDARALAIGGAPEGTVVVVRYQRAGRGRLGRTWWSEAGSGLLTSWVVRPSWPPERWPLLPLAAGVATARAVRESTRIEAVLKWPNDVLIGEAKVAGILTEARPPDFAIVGLGLNLRGRVPPEHAAEAVSLEQAGAKEPDAAALLEEILRRFAGVIADPDAIVPAYRALCATIGRRVRVETPGGSPDGIAADVDASGALVVTTSGRTQRIAAGDVIHVRSGPT